MKKLTEMNNRELFSILTGADVIPHAYRQKVVRLHLEYKQKNNIKEDCDLMTMVREYMDGVYGEIKE